MHNPASSFTRASFLRWHTLTHMYYARLAKPNSPRSLSTWLSFYPEPDGGWIWGDVGGDRARKSSPGAEGRVLIQSTLSSSGGMRRHDPFLTIFIPSVSCSLSLFHLPCVCVCDHFFYINCQGCGPFMLNTFVAFVPMWHHHTAASIYSQMPVQVDSFTVSPQACLFKKIATVANKQGYKNWEMHDLPERQQSTTCACTQRTKK